MKIKGTITELTKILDLIKCPTEANKLICNEQNCWNCISKYNNIIIEFEE